MKPLNRKHALWALAILEAIVIIPLCVLQGMGKMSGLTFVLALFTILFLSLAAVVLILYKYPITTAEKKEGFDPDSVHVGRTREGTTFEVITGLLVAAAWAIALASRHFIGDGGEILYREIFDMVMLTSCIAFLLIDVYTPSFLFLAGKLTNVKQVGLAVRMDRSLALIIAVFLILYATPALHYNWLAVCIFALFLVTVIVFRIFIHKAK